MIAVLLIYFFIGWIFGMVNFLLSLKEKYDRNYNISITMAVVLYWPIVAVAITINFFKWLKRKYKKAR